MVGLITKLSILKETLRRRPEKRENMIEKREEKTIRDIIEHTHTHTQDIWQVQQGTSVVQIPRSGRRRTCFKWLDPKSSPQNERSASMLPREKSPEITLKEIEWRKTPKNTLRGKEGKRHLPDDIIRIAYSELRPAEQIQSS